MKPHEERVVTEKHELYEKLVKLGNFVLTDACLNLHFNERDLLAQQLRVMKEYSAVLGQRIKLFQEKNNV